MKQLKCLIGRCQRLLDQPSKPKHGHRLGTLWADLGGLLDVTYPHEEPLDRSVVDRLLTQLAELDPDNQEFRYAERRNGAPTMADVRHLDIDKVHTAMLGLANYLEAIESAIDHDEDMKQVLKDAERLGSRADLGATSLPSPASTGRPR